LIIGNSKSFHLGAQSTFKITLDENTGQENVDDIGTVRAFNWAGFIKGKMSDEDKADASRSSVDEVYKVVYCMYKHSGRRRDGRFVWPPLSPPITAHCAG